MAEELPKPAPNVLYGFVYQGANGLEAYANAYFPAVWDCWRDVSRPSAITRISVSSEVPAYLRKKAACGQLMSLFDERYFSIVGER